MRARDPQAFGKVGVLLGGMSAEREISLMSGKGVLAALKSKGVDAHAFDPAERQLGELATEAYARVFIALHGRFGEDGAIQGALELLGIPYTGSGVMGSAVAMDKVFTKRIWENHGLQTPRYAVLDARSFNSGELRRVPDALGLPLIVKPPHEGSTIGISKVAGYSQMHDAYALAARFDDVVLAEEFITGRELTVAIVELEGRLEALPIIEIVAPEGNYDYQNKYFTDDTRYVCPATIADDLAARIRSVALEAFDAIGCESWGRVDFMLRASDSEPFLLEVNTSPGMTGHSLVPMAARAVGLSYEDLCVEVLASARLKTRRAKLSDAFVTATSKDDH
ncbi:MAG: D-alanine--D-alanine ligase [Burkholderiaceae bacterium]